VASDTRSSLDTKWRRTAMREPSFRHHGGTPTRMRALCPYRLAAPSEPDASPLLVFGIIPGLSRQGRSLHSTTAGRCEGAAAPAQCRALSRYRAALHRDVRHGAVAGLAASGFDRGGWKSARVAIDSSGRATVSSGSMSQGHGQATVPGADCATRCRCQSENNRRRAGRHETGPSGHGTFNSAFDARRGSSVKVVRGVSSRRRRGSSPR